MGHNKMFVGHGCKRAGRLAAAGDGVKVASSEGHPPARQECERQARQRRVSARIWIENSFVGLEGFRDGCAHLLEKGRMLADKAGIFLLL